MTVLYALVPIKISMNCHSVAQASVKLTHPIKSEPKQKNVSLGYTAQGKVSPVKSNFCQGRLGCCPGHTGCLQPTVVVTINCIFGLLIFCSLDAYLQLCMPSASHDFLPDLCFNPDDQGDIFLRSVGMSANYIPSHFRREYFSESVL
jgi:hypothetical protein